MNKVKVYADGSCYQQASSTGEGAFAAIIIFPDKEVELAEYFKVTTNNRMELMGIISSLEYLKEPTNVEIYSDSAYVVNCFLQKWFIKWFKNGWINSNKKPVVNKDLWIRLMTAMKGHKIKFIKVKGHSDDEFNNRCDKLAKETVENSRNQRDVS